MTEYIVIGAVLVCIFLYFIIKKSIENSREKKLKAIVAWCATDNSNMFRCNLHLWEYISDAQIKLKLLQEYRISTEEEWDLVKEIITDFQKDITQKYFYNQNNSSLYFFKIYTIYFSCYSNIIICHLF